jgi:probable phosphoglycerate mutase
MQRTRDTAAIIMGPHGKEVTARDGLREIHHGHWEERTRKEVEAQFPEEYACWEKDPYSFAPAGGETGLAVSARSLPALLDIVRAHDDQIVLVVSHKATIRLLLSSLLGFDPRTYRDRLDQSPACLNILDFRGPTNARLMLFNDVSHYATSRAKAPGTAEKRLSPIWSGQDQDDGKTE